ncbi:MAG: anthranilate phosphoribosyltransferase [Methermicoccaceae archaeon]
MKDYITTLLSGNDLTVEEAQQAMVGMLRDATDAQIASFLTAMYQKRVSPEELAGLAQGMESLARRITPEVAGMLDTCGTGGDNMSTINVSTAAAIIASACGVPVAKHGNYSFTSKCGSADVLLGLGIDINQPIEMVKRSIERVGFGFMLAPAFHPSMQRVSHIRRELGFRTVFNILGPLTNPASADYRLLGVYSEELIAPIAMALSEMGVKHAMVVHGHGMDEISCANETTVYEVTGRTVESYRLSPEDFGLPVHPVSSIIGGDAYDNANALMNVFSGRRGAHLDFILLNASAALYVAGITTDLKEGVEIATNSIDEGEVLKKLDELKKFSHTDVKEANVSNTVQD